MKSLQLLALCSALSITLAGCGGSSSGNNELADTSQSTVIDSTTSTETETHNDNSTPPVDNETSTDNTQPTDSESGADDTVIEAGIYRIVDTNQSTCFNSATGATTPCTSSGYDADYSGSQPDYTLSDSKLSVTDNVTGLVWTQSSDLNNDGSLNYSDKRWQSDAISYCANLNLDGISDWRLPSIKESYSLILFNGKDASSYQGTDTSTLTPFIDPVFDWAFGDLTTAEGIAAGDRIIDGQYASTTSYVSTTMNNDATMFGVNYVDGRVKGYPKTFKKFYVRCVSGNELYGINNFINNGDETISDLATGLMWQQSDTTSSNWGDAVAQCESAASGSHTDWRLPNVKELQSLVDYSKSPDTDSDAAINSVFQSTAFLNEEGITDWGYYWSSTTHMDNAGDGSNAAYVSFGRALGYMNGQILDVHGAGSQRSNDKLNVATEPGAKSATSNGTFYYKGPQGDILRMANMVRCVRDI